MDNSTSFGKFSNPCRMGTTWRINTYYKNPEDTALGVFTFIVLVLSIAVKSFMYVINKKKSKQSDSASLKAISIDCLSDAVATTVVLISMVINVAFSLNVDGYRICTYDDS